jgi:hypothetical protein
VKQSSLQTPCLDEAKEKRRFLDVFSLEGYRELLLAFKRAGYSFCGFNKIERYLVEGQQFIVLRHDLDIGLHPALEIARIEHEQGVQATYFVTLHSPFYNALSHSSAEIMLQLHQWGHQIALHADLTAYAGDCDKALLEVGILAQFYPFINTQLASLHSPINLEQMPIASFEQLQNVYGHVFSKDITYISDSTGRWRYGHPLESEAFLLRKPIQLLTHPIWWIQGFEMRNGRSHPGLACGSREEDGEMATQKLECWLYRDYLNTLATAETFLPKLFRRRKAQ